MTEGGPTSQRSKMWLCSCTHSKAQETFKETLKARNESVPALRPESAGFTV